MKNKFHRLPRWATLVLLAAALFIVTSCTDSLVKVKPWERGVLSGSLMRPDFNTMEDFDRNHIYFSKEGTYGGFKNGGGGCGCN